MGNVVGSCSLSTLVNKLICRASKPKLSIQSGLLLDLFLKEAANVVSESIRLIH